MNIKKRNEIALEVLKVLLSNCAERIPNTDLMFNLVNTSVIFADQLTELLKCDHSGSQRVPDVDRGYFCEKCEQIIFRSE